MNDHDQSLIQFLSEKKEVIKIELMEVLGSSPRNAGTAMYVATEALRGTIGGGQLEYMLIDQAREMLKEEIFSQLIDIPLGPEIGQCCGGHVSASLTLMSEEEKENTCQKVVKELADMPHVYVLGSGHVGRALANQFQHLPIRCILIDSREEELQCCKANVEIRQSAIAEVDIQEAPPGSAYIILTHDHGLDFLLASTALARRDAAYVGMIGSATKRAKFISWCRKNYEQIQTENLQCPIGTSGSCDKRPSVIAAFVTAEVIAALTTEADEASLEKTIDMKAGKQLTGGGHREQ